MDPDWSGRRLGQDQGFLEKGKAPHSKWGNPDAGRHCADFPDHKFCPIQTPSLPEYNDPALCSPLGFAPGTVASIRPIHSLKAVHLHPAGNICSGSHCGIAYRSLGFPTGVCGRLLCISHWHWPGNMVVLSLEGSAEKDYRDRRFELRVA